MTAHSRRGSRATGSRRRTERGSAIADFVLAAVVLVPLFFGILQLALIWHVKSTLTSAASQGAQFGAAYRHTPADGAHRTRVIIRETFGGDFRDRVTAHPTRVVGYRGVEVRVVAEVPVLFLWGPHVQVTATGHAIAEVLP